MLPLSGPARERNAAILAALGTLPAGEDDRHEQPLLDALQL